jgi:gluconokinase
MCLTATAKTALFDSPMVLVVMGVSGCGKSTVASALAKALGWNFMEGDAFHPPENVRRMAQGIALNDDDRVVWLDSLAKELTHQLQQGQSVVLACSALKKAYRDVLRRACPDAFFVHLAGTPDLIAQRLASRKGHYMPPSLLQSQFDTLEPPTQAELACRYDVSQTPQAIVDDLLIRLPQV